MNYVSKDHHPHNTPESQRISIINCLGQRIGARDYLEIGYCDGSCFKNVNIANKTAVDPKPKIHEPKLVEATSDKFFENNQKTWDIVFVDGLHRYLQVKRDIENSLEALNPGGYIVCHDMGPFTQNDIHRSGDCWKAFVALRSERDDLEMFTVDCGKCDYGIGVITRGSQEKIELNIELSTGIFDNWEEFEKNRKEWMNTISIDEFNSYLDTIKKEKN